MGEVKICPKDQESTCSTERISDGQPVNCSNFDFSSVYERKQRSDHEKFPLVAQLSTSIQINVIEAFEESEHPNFEDILRLDFLEFHGTPWHTEFHSPVAYPRYDIWFESHDSNDTLIVICENSLNGSCAAPESHGELSIIGWDDDLLEDYSVTLANCAVSPVYSPYNPREETKKNYTALFWYEFCPVNKYLVSPQSEPLSSEWGNSYLNEYWERDSALHSVRFSIPTVLAEAGFDGLQEGYFINEAESWVSDRTIGSVALADFHCEVKICPKDEESTCSTERISDGQPTTCLYDDYGILEDLDESSDLENAPIIAHLSAFVQISATSYDSSDEGL